MVVKQEESFAYTALLRRWRSQVFGNMNLVASYFNNSFVTRVNWCSKWEIPVH